MTIPISFGIGGLLGWKVLQRMEGRQKEIVAKSPTVQRHTDHFRDRLEFTDTADKLVGDYRMLRVALGAFGLQDDIGNKAFIKKVLKSDLDDRTSLANRLSDKRYFRLAEAFDFHGKKNRTDSPNDDQKKVHSIEFTNQIATAYRDREFEIRVGIADESLRLALNARREIAGFGSRDSSEKTLWYEVLGNPPLRKVFESAFGFGAQLAKFPIERQLTEMMNGAERLFGSSSFTSISEPENTEKLIRNFLVRSESATSSGQNRFSAALALLSQ